MAQSEFDHEKSLGFLVQLAGRRLRRALERRLGGHGVALGHFPILLALWEEENLTQSEIARRLDIEQPTVANTLKRMERDGLVAASPDPGNARRVLFRLTAHARELEAAVKGEAMAVNAEAARDLAPGELGRLVATLRRVIEALEAERTR